MKVSVNYGDGVLSLPINVLKNIESTGEDELKLLIYLCSLGDKTEFSAQSASSATGLSASEVESALSYWRGAGLVKVKGRKTKAEKPACSSNEETKREEKPQRAQGELKVFSTSPPQYSGPELDNLCLNKRSLGFLRDECQKLLNRPIHHRELNYLVTLYDYFSLDEAYILLLLQLAREKSDPVKYAYTVAVGYVEKGIVTYDALCGELERLEQKNSFEGRMKKLFGIDNRKLTAREKKFFEEWQKYDIDLVEYAYDVTVDNTGKPSMPYMNKVIMGLTEQGIRSRAEAEKAAEKYKSSKKTDKNSGFDEDDFFNIALQSTKNKNKK